MSRASPASAAASGSRCRSPDTQCSAIHAAICVISAGGKSCPMPATISSRAPRMFCAVSLPAATGTSGSLAPWITSVRAVTSRSSARRSPDARMAPSCRAVPSGYSPRRATRSRCGRRSAASCRNPGLPMIAEQVHQVIDDAVDIGGIVGRTAQQGPQCARLAQCDLRPRIARGRHDRGQRQHALRPQCGQAPARSCRPSKRRRRGPVRCRPRRAHPRHPGPCRAGRKAR